MPYLKTHNSISLSCITASSSPVASPDDIEFIDNFTTIVCDTVDNVWSLNCKSEELKTSNEYLPIKDIEA